MWAAVVVQFLLSFDWNYKQIKNDLMLGTVDIPNFRNSSTLRSSITVPYSMWLVRCSYSSLTSSLLLPAPSQYVEVQSNLICICWLAPNFCHTWNVLQYIDKIDLSTSSHLPFRKWPIHFAAYTRSQTHTHTHISKQVQIKIEGEEQQNFVFARAVRSDLYVSYLNWNMCMSI